MDKITTENFEHELRRVLGHLADLQLEDAATVVGVSDEEIACLEQHFKIRLPLVYKRFLSVCGKRPHLLYSADLLLYTNLFDTRDRIQEGFDEGAFYPEVSEKAFFFYAFETREYRFFTCDGDDNPEVYKIIEGDSRIYRVTYYPLDSSARPQPRLAQFLVDSIQSIPAIIESYDRTQRELQEGSERSKQHMKEWLAARGRRE